MDMCQFRNPDLRLYRCAAIGLAAFASLALQVGRAQDKAAKQAEAARRPWRAFGKVTDQDGKPMAGVEVWANCGIGTLRRTGTATSGADGKYELIFGPGIMYTRGKGDETQAANISAHKPSFFEANLNRQGGCAAAHAMPDDDQVKRWGVGKDRLFLPDRPIEINFVMRPAARVSGKLVDEQGRPLTKYSVALNGADLPPGHSVMCSEYADDQGRFMLEDVPTTFRYQFVVRKTDPKPPWDDTWASAALRFEKPEQGDLRAWFDKREIRVREFILRVAGPGVHGRTAVPLAGNAGVLNLTAAPADVEERSNILLAATSAVLTLTNAPKPDVGESLIKDSVPAAASGKSKTRLARTRPNDAGEFSISFENPRGFELARGKHQVIFQVFVGTSQKPIRERIFKQLDIRDGRYEVPVRIPPELVDDSRVSITFVSIQPNHDEWVKSFFREGKGTKYEGIWTGESSVLPAIPYSMAGGR
jgi:hypothetical protein